MLCLCAGMANADSGAEAAQAAEGARHFIHCSGCHTLPDAQAEDFGPDLRGIVGRQAGTLDGYAYTEAMHGHDFIWTEDKLDAWLKQPQQVLPGVCLPFWGLRQEQARQALIEYLKHPQAGEDAP